MHMLLLSLLRCRSHHVLLLSDCFLLLLLLLLSVIPNSSSFSASPKNINILPITTNSHEDEPTILSLSNIFTPKEVDDILQFIDNSSSSSSLIPTSATYQEDVFSKEAWDAEDVILRNIVQPIVEDGTMIPPPNQDKDDSYEKEAALRSFVHAVTHHPDRIGEDDIIIGANIIQRREAIERWKSDEGLSIMKLSMDYDIMMKEEDDDIDWDAISLGKRYEVPSEVLDKIIEQIIPTVLKGGTRSWTTTDATIVKYQEGDLQVPHIDPCDATLLICLEPCIEGGSTCFPLLDPPRRLENTRGGDGYLFFSSQATMNDDDDSTAGFGERERNVLSLHHGGRVVKGDKIVMQLMLEYTGDDDVQTWLEVIA